MQHRPAWYPTAWERGRGQRLGLGELVRLLVDIPPTAPESRMRR